jgi:hypothetical protein
MRVALNVLDAARRAGRYPEAFPWVGSVYPQLADVPRQVRRVLTKDRRHVVYYWYQRDAQEVVVLSVRGSGQLPPLPRELGA